METSKRFVCLLDHHSPDAYHEAMYPSAGRSVVYSPTTAQANSRMPVSGSYRMMENGSDMMTGPMAPGRVSRGPGGPTSSVYEVNYEISV